MLVLIDLQNDYFHPEGKFYFDGAQELVGILLARIRSALDAGEPIIHTLNLYSEEDGRSRGERDWASALYEPFRDLLSGQAPLTKYYYGISADAGKLILERFRDDPPSSIEVAGVETHLCVLANAVVFQNMYPKADLAVALSSVGSSDPNLERQALAVMRGMNMRILE